jgi:hypothetical protein
MRSCFRIFVITCYKYLDEFTDVRRCPRDPYSVGYSVPMIMAPAAHGSKRLAALSTIYGFPGQDRARP